MNTLSSLDLITSAFVSFGTALIALVGLFLGTALGMLIFHIGKKFLMDESFMVGGYYLRKTPYKGYNRFHSQSWNSTHTT